jgi:hypothetical protein
MEIIQIETLYANVQVVDLLVLLNVFIMRLLVWKHK